MSVESSLAVINFVNLYDEKNSSKVKQKETLYVQNRLGSSKKLKITLSKTSHSVMTLVCLNLRYYCFLLSRLSAS